jgi:hypothetical protein
LNKTRYAYWLILIFFFLSSCGIQMDSTTPTGEQIDPSSSLTSEPVIDTPTPLAPVGVFLTPPGSDPELAAQINPIIAEYIREEGYRFQILETMSPDDFNRDDFRLVIVLPPHPDLAGLAQEAPQAKFLAVGFNDLETSSNLSVLRSGGGDFDVQGFIAGYIAAMITADWRVGVLSVQENEDGFAAREGFRVGVKYYCGLCNPKYAPTGINYIYPKYIDLPKDASSLEIEANVNFLIDRYVQTFYIVPGIGNPQIYAMLVSNNKKIIGPGSDFQEDYRDNWVVSLEYDLLDSLIEIWPLFIDSDEGIEMTPPLMLTDINNDYLSPGKVILAEKILEDVTNGYIKTSIE